MKWKISILGTRGSAPITGRDFEEYGGDTLCVAVECEDRLFVFDAGTGIRHLKQREGNSYFHQPLSPGSHSGTGEVAGTVKSRK